MRGRALVGVAALAVALTLPGAGAPTTVRRSDSAQLNRVFAFGLFWMTTSDRDLRECSTDCRVEARALSTRAAEWQAAATDVPVVGLTTRQRFARTNSFQMFRRYNLAGRAYLTGVYRNYISQLRQAITQGAAAATRLGFESLFNYNMTVAGCSGWKLALRRPGADPCR